MFNSGKGTSRLLYLTLIIIGISGIGLGVHSASAACGDAPGPGVDYTSCNLAGTDFSGYDLTSAKFVNANLVGASFAGDTIDDADFTGAHLMTADFSGINTSIGSNTVFLNANLTRAIFTNANSGEGSLSFQNADLHYVDFSGTDLSNSELTSGADITGSNFSGATIQATDFTKSIMKNVIFTGAYVQNSIFNSVDFHGSYLGHLDLSNNNFEGANFLGANLTGTSMINADLLDSQLGGIFTPTSFQNADLHYVDFTGARMSSDTIFIGADTIGATLACTGNSVCSTGGNPPPVIHFDNISFTGGTSIGQVNSTAWKFSAASASGSNIQYTGVYATIGSTTIFQGSNLDCTPNATVFPLGTNQVTCIATDPSDSSNTSTSHFYIIIADNSPPAVIPPPSPVIAEATGPLGANVIFHVTATDVVHGSLTPVCTPGNGTFAIGSTSVICTATDPDGNTGSATFPITVQDTTAPYIITGNVTAQATSPSGATIFYHVTAYDLVDGHVTPTCLPSLNGTTFSLGSTTTLTCSATDSHHNTSAKPLVIKVIDTTAPTFTSLPLPTITKVATGTLTQVTLTNPPVSDNADPSPIMTNNAPSAGYTVGETDVTWTVTDHSGNSNTAIQPVVITSNGALVTITAPVDVTAQATGPLTQVNNLGTPTWSDPFDSHPVITNNASATGYPVKTTIVMWNISDKFGNTAHSPQAVIIQDTIAPTITPSSNPQYTEATSSNGAQVFYHVTAYDLVDGKVVPQCDLLNGTTLAISSTTVTCSATDAHQNTSHQSFTVTVRDTTGPVITLPPTNPVIVEAVNQNGAPVTYSVTAIDAVTGPTPVTCSPPSGNFGLGNTQVICTSTDTATPPNTSTKSFVVTVHDTTPPTITAPPSITKIATGTLTQVTLGTPTVSDLVDPIPTVTNNAPSAGYPVGTTTVTWTATDHIGNHNSATQIVKILPNNTPGKVNGGGSIEKFVKFDMNVQSKDGLSFKGHLDFDDKNAKISLDSKTITGLYVDQTATKANFTGTATLNGHTGYTFKAYVIDNGNPGKNDFFQISIFDSAGNPVYVHSGKLGTGNLHVSNKSDVDDDKHDTDPRDKWAAASNNSKK